MKYQKKPLLLFLMFMRLRLGPVCWDYKLDYSQIIIQISHTYQIYAKSRSALGRIHIPLNQT
jgi:hypothetical protein